MVRIVRVALATASTYVLGYSVMTVGVLMGCLAALVGWNGFIRVGTRVWANFVFIIAGRLPRVRGAENICDDRPYLIVANHSSMYDIPALMSAVPDVALMGRDYLTRIPLFGQFLSAVHYIPIATDNARSARAALELAVKRLNDGISVGIFPEGTRTTTGELQPLKRGFVAVLRKSGADLLPVSIQGTFTLQPKGKHTLDPAEPILVKIGRPIPSAELVAMDDDQIRHRVSTVLKGMGESRS